MVEHSARAAAICAVKGSIGAILSVSYFDRMKAGLIDMETTWWDVFWHEMSYITETVIGK